MRKLLTAVALAAIALTACSSDGGVSVTPPTPTGMPAAACKDLDAHLPDTVDGTKASGTSPDSPYTAAWGDILLTCGGQAPKLDPTAQLVTIQGVDWYPEELPQGGTRFTAIDIIAPVSVTVPATRQPEADALVDISPAVNQYIPSADA